MLAIEPIYYPVNGLYCLLVDAYLIDGLQPRSQMCLVSNQLTVPRRALDVNKANELSLAWLAKLASENPTVSVTLPPTYTCMNKTRSVN